MEQSPRQMIVTLWCYADRLQDVPQIVTVADGTCHYAVDVSTYQVVWVTIVRAKHYFVRILLQQRDECLIVFGRRTLAYLDDHTGFHTGPCFLESHTLVFCGDACRSITSALLAHQTWSMSVYRFAIALGCRYLRHHFLFAGKHAGKVHHFCKEPNVVSRHEFLYVMTVERGTAGFYFRATRRNT